jgi:hypothetical protein
MHSLIPIFGAKVVDKGIATLSLLQVHLFLLRDFPLSSRAYFITGLSFVRTQTRGEVVWFVFTGPFLPFQVEKPLPSWRFKGRE